MIHFKKLDIITRNDRFIFFVQNIVLPEKTYDDSENADI